MTRLWQWVKRLAKADVEAPRTRLTREQAIEIGRQHLMGDDELFRPGAGPTVEDGRTVWRVVTHVGYRGGHSQVYIDDETGNVIRTQHVDR